MGLTSYSSPDPTDVVGRRIGAALIDGGFEIASVALGLALADVRIEVSAATGVVTGVEGSPTAFWILLAVPWLFILGNRVALQGLHGYTLGKLLVGLRCVNALGRPPGVGRALGRAIVLNGPTRLVGCIWDLLNVALMLAVRGHRHTGDLAAKTFVVKKEYQGRLLLPGDRHYVAGPASVTRAEAAAMEARGARAVVGGSEVGDPVRADPEPEAPPEAPEGLSAVPTWDASIKAYVVYDAPSGRWLRYRRSTGTWIPME